MEDHLAKSLDGFDSTVSGNTRKYVDNTRELYMKQTEPSARAYEYDAVA